MGKLADRSSKKATRTEPTRGVSVIGSSVSEADRFRTQRSRESFRDPLDRVAGAAIINESIEEVADLEAQTATSTRDEELREEIEENLSEFQVEQREEVLSESGGSSRATEVIGDEEDEEIQIISNQVLVGFRRNLSSGGFYQSLDPVFAKLEVPSIMQKAKNQSNNSVLIGCTFLRGGRTTLRDYRAISRLEELKIELETRKIIYSAAEENAISFKLSSDKLNENQIIESVEQFLDTSNQEEVEGSIILNKSESNKKIKLSSVSENLPQFQPRTSSQTQSTESSSTTSQQIRTQVGSVASVPTGVSTEVLEAIEDERRLAPGRRGRFEPPRGTY
jgi:hypothetical protein